MRPWVAETSAGKTSINEVGMVDVQGTRYLQKEALDSIENPTRRPGMEKEGGEGGKKKYRTSRL